MHMTTNQQNKVSKMSLIKNLYTVVVSHTENWLSSYMLSMIDRLIMEERTGNLKVREEQKRVWKIETEYILIP